MEMIEVLSLLCAVVGIFYFLYIMIRDSKEWHDDF